MPKQQLNLFDLMPNAKNGDKKALNKHKIKIKRKKDPPKPSKLQVIVTDFLVPKLINFQLIGPSAQIAYRIILFFGSKTLTFWCVAIQDADRDGWLGQFRLKVLGMEYMRIKMAKLDKKQRKLAKVRV